MGRKCLALIPFQPCYGSPDVWFERTNTSTALLRRTIQILRAPSTEYGTDAVSKGREGTREDVP